MVRVCLLVNVEMCESLALRHDRYVADVSIALCIRCLSVTDAACMEVGAHDKLVETVLTSLLQSPQYVSAVSRFDLVILVRRTQFASVFLSFCLSCSVLVSRVHASVLILNACQT